MKKRILFLADRNILVDQTLVNDFKPFGDVMTKAKNRKIDPSYEIHLGLYQALTGTDEADKIFKTVSPDFFDLIVVDVGFLPELVDLGVAVQAKTGPGGRAVALDRPLFGRSVAHVLRTARGPVAALRVGRS